MQGAVSGEQWDVVLVELGQASPVGDSDELAAEKPVSPLNKGLEIGLGGPRVCDVLAGLRDELAPGIDDSGRGGGQAGE